MQPSPNRGNSSQTRPEGMDLTTLINEMITNWEGGGVHEGFILKNGEISKNHSTRLTHFQYRLNYLNNTIFSHKNQEFS